MIIPIDRLKSPDNATHTLHIYHANGFPPTCYRLLSEALPDDYEVIGLHARPLWKENGDLEHFDSWQIMADDLLKGLDDYGYNQVIGVGHSMGGVSTVMAAIKEPQRFKALILLDPTFLPKYRVLMLFRLLKKIGRLRLPFVESALNRTTHWESEQAAFDRYRSRKLFQRFSDEALWDYIHAISEPDEGDSIQLAFTPEFEAEIYRTIPTDIWDLVTKITVPTYVLGGEDTNTFMADSVKRWRKIRPDIPLDVLPTLGHLLPMEAPELVAKRMVTFIDHLES